MQAPSCHWAGGCCPRGSDPERACGQEQQEGCCAVAGTRGPSGAGGAGKRARWELGQREGCSCGSSQNFAITDPSPRAALGQALQIAEHHPRETFTGKRCPLGVHLLISPPWTTPRSVYR